MLLRRQVNQLQRQVAKLEREAIRHRDGLAGGIGKVVAMLRRVDSAQQAEIEALREQVTDLRCESRDLPPLKIVGGCCDG